MLNREIRILPRILLIACVMLLLSACGDSGAPNPLIPTEELSLGNQVQISIVTAYPIVATNMDTTVRVRVDSIPVSGIYCVKATLTAPAGFTPGEQQQTLASIVNAGSYNIDFPLEASASPSSGILVARMEWNQDSSCATTQQQASTFYAIGSAAPWKVYVQLDRLCFVDGEQDAVFTLAGSESWQYRVHKQVESPWVAEFEVPPVIAEYQAGASAFCMAMAGNVVEWVNGIPQFSPEASSIMIGAESVATITGPGQTITLGVPPELHPLIEIEEAAVPEQPAAALLPVIPEQPVVTMPPVIPEQPAITQPPTVPEQPAATQPPTIPEQPAATQPPIPPEQPAPIVPEATCSWQEEIIGFWDGDWFFEFAPGGFGTIQISQMRYQCDPQTNQLIIEILDGGGESRFTVEFDDGYLVLTSLGNPPGTMVLQRVQ